MEWFGVIVGSIIIGAIVGPLARLALPGRQNVGMMATILLGAAGALIGGFIYTYFGGGETGGIDWIRLLIQIASAAVVIVIWIKVKGTKDPVGG